MKFSGIVLLSLLATTNAVGQGSIRGEEEDLQVDFSCTLKGGSSQNVCDSTKADDGSSCVWCSVVSYGVCVTADVAEQMEQTIPGIDCDGNGSDDDDSAPSDDAAPADDDTTPSDDSVPDDYWDCLEKYSTSDACIAAGCGWCDNKGGYGVCFDVETAKDFEDSDWYSCTMPSLESEPLKDPTEKEESAAVGEPLNLFDPSDPSCLVITISGDESTCKETTDVDGKPCDWCSFQGYEFCVNVDQAQIVETYGADCGDRVEDLPKTAKVADPSDPSCLIQTLTGDESTCKGTMDVDGNSCDWCSFQGYEFCVNVDQAQIVEAYGADCGDRVEDLPKTAKVADPSDPSCLIQTLTGDESTCKGTMDVDGNSCEWCSFQGYDFCVNVDQAQIVEAYGADCGNRVEDLPKTAKVADPSDPSCLMQTLTGDESTCKGTMDVDGNSCEWCSFQGYDFCLDADQAEVVEAYGASCEKEVINVSISVA